MKREKIVERYKCGIVSDDWTDALTKLSSDKKLREEMAINGFKAFKMNYSWNIQEQKLLKVYSNLLEGGTNN